MYLTSELNLVTSASETEPETSDNKSGGPILHLTEGWADTYHGNAC